MLLIDYLHPGRSQLRRTGARRGPATLSLMFPELAAKLLLPRETFYSINHKNNIAGASPWVSWQIPFSGLIFLSRVQRKIKRTLRHFLAQADGREMDTWVPFTDKVSTDKSRRGLDRIILVPPIRMALHKPSTNRGLSTHLCKFALVPSFCGLCCVYPESLC